MSFLKSKVVLAAKDLGFPEECQDAAAVNVARGIAVIADGVAASLFSGQWARVLTESVIESPPDLNVENALTAWAALPRKKWSESVDLSSLNYFQRKKFQSTGASSYSTLLWAQVLPRVQDGNSDAKPEYELRACAIGDCCLFHFRDGFLLKSFPINQFEDFDTHPLSMESVNRNHDELIEIQEFSSPCFDQDLLVLATDAFAHWILRTLQQGGSIDWTKYWQFNEADWRAHVRWLRDNDGLKYDDTTLILAEVGPSPVLEAVEGDAVDATSEDVFVNETFLDSQSPAATEPTELQTDYVGGFEGENAEHAIEHSSVAAELDADSTTDSPSAAAAAENEPPFGERSEPESKSPQEGIDETTGREVESTQHEVDRHANHLPAAEEQLHTGQQNDSDADRAQADITSLAENPDDHVEQDSAIDGRDSVNAPPRNELTGETLWQRWLKKLRP